jgi:hypothetical protein
MPGQFVMMVVFAGDAAVAAARFAKVFRCSIGVGVGAARHEMICCQVGLAAAVARLSWLTF